MARVIDCTELMRCFDRNTVRRQQVMLRGCRVTLHDHDPTTYGDGYPCIHKIKVMPEGLANQPGKPHIVKLVTIFNTQVGSVCLADSPCWQALGSFHDPEFFHVWRLPTWYLRVESPVPVLVRYEVCSFRPHPWALRRFSECGVRVNVHAWLRDLSWYLVQRLSIGRFLYIKDAGFYSHAILRNNPYSPRVRCRPWRDSHPDWFDTLVVSYQAKNLFPFLEQQKAVNECMIVPWQQDALYFSVMGGYDECEDLIPVIRQRLNQHPEFSAILGAVLLPELVRTVISYLPLEICRNCDARTRNAMFERLAETGWTVFNEMQRR